VPLQVVNDQAFGRLLTATHALIVGCDPERGGNRNPLFTQQSVNRDQIINQKLQTCEELHCARLGAHVDLPSAGIAILGWRGSRSDGYQAALVSAFALPVGAWKPF
jgi:hypothetical protein